MQRLVMIKEVYKGDEFTVTLNAETRKTIRCWGI